MKKKTFKVIVSNELFPVLREVTGYFVWLNDLRVFIYHDYEWNYWYVIDLDTGCSIANGQTMTSAKVNALNRLNKLTQLKDMDEYKQKRFLYQKLLKG